MDIRETLKDKRRIVIKVGSSSLIHPETGDLDLVKLEKLVRIMSDIKNQGKDVILVSSGAISVGRRMLGLTKKPEVLSMKQACAALGQGELMMIYQKLFSEYNHKAAQVLLTFDVITSDERRKNAENTLKQLIDLDIIPIVNENDTVAIEEIEFGDNDTLSAIVLKDMAKGSGSTYGTGGMYTKVAAAEIACHAGADLAILSSTDLNLIVRLLNGKDVGTLFVSDTSTQFDIMDYIVNKKYLES